MANNNRICTWEELGNSVGKLIFIADNQGTCFTARIASEPKMYNGSMTIEVVIINIDPSNNVKTFLSLERFNIYRNRVNPNPRKPWLTWAF